MEKFIYIRNGEDDAYLNSVSNFRGMEQKASGAVLMYFESPLSSSNGAYPYDSITLAVTANSEKEAMVAIARKMSSSRSDNYGAIVIADDHASKYCDGTVTGVTTISKATGAVLRKVESVTPGGDATGGAADANTRILRASDSGTTFFANIGTNSAAFRLPDPIAGLNYTFVLDIDSDAENTKDLIVSTNNNAVNIIGTQLDAGAINDSGVGASVLKLAASGAAAGAGDRFSVVCDGTHYYVEDAVALTAGIFAIAANAI